MLMLCRKVLNAGVEVTDAAVNDMYSCEQLVCSLINGGRHI